MAKPRLYNHTRFDGGMTHNNRDTSDLTKSSFIAHLDIYRENHRAYVMPGFVSFNAYNGTATGLKTHDVRNFVNLSGYIFALGTKADGTGSKVFQFLVGTDSEWSNATTFGFHAEGAEDLIDHPFFTTVGGQGAYFPVKDGASAVDIARVQSNVYSAAWYNRWLPSTPTGSFAYTYSVRGFDGRNYLVKGGSGSGISEITTSTVTVDAKTTGIIPLAIASGDYSIGIAGVISNPRDSRVLVWDSASLLADQNIRLGSESVRVIGFPNNVYTTVSFPAFSDLETNGASQMAVRVLQGESAQLIYKLYAPNATAAGIRQHDINEYYFNAMLWYARIPTNAAGTEFVGGVWAAGAGSASSQFGVSMLLDTSTLGVVERAVQIGQSTFFAHNEDGSVSRLDDFETGTFDVPGYIETLFYGSDTPFLKQLEGVSVVTENLPVGGTVEVQYRTDENAAFISMGTSDTDNKQVHNFTKVAGVPIGKFREIQFKIILTGKIALKSYLVSTTENDDLSFSV